MTVAAPPAVLYGDCGVRLDPKTKSVRAALLRAISPIGEVMPLTTENAARELAPRGERPICADCRRVLQKFSPAPAERMRRWWIEQSGLTFDEVQAIARLGWSR